MHPCLEVPEIQMAIARSFSISNRSNQSLAALARTCRSFQDPALNVLWREQNTLSQLVLVMPSDLWRLEDEDKPIFLRCLTENDWERFAYYGSKIHVLELKTSENFGVDETVLRQLSTYRPVKQLFPRLESLQLVLGTENTFSCIEYLPVLLADTLTELSITRNFPGTGFNNDSAYHDYSIQHFLCSLARCCPNLNYLHIPWLMHRGMIAPGMGFTLESFFSNVNNLRTLIMSLQDVTPNLVHSLGRLPKLSTLLIDNPPGFNRRPQHLLLGQPQSRFTAASLSAGFAELTSLELGQIGAQDLDVVLNYVPNTLTEIEASGARGPADFIELVTPLRRFTNLTTLTLFFDNFNFHPLHQNTALISSIIALPKLRSVWLEGFPVDALTDDFLSHIPEAWPCLESLVAAPKRRERPCMTLAGLIPISRKCATLKELTIAVICQPFDVNRPDFTTGVSQIESLDLRNSPVEQPMAVLRCITLLFPKLQSVYALRGNKDINPESHEFCKALQEAFP